ncbi:unnamed protein product [Acanthoscelides obtectus]|uniref:non-specific serine/threonine protein kinase n=1 Tax=Acanthoscelides obtectus TaxID=200917 RepID=A0A9P0Q1F0_ACAOB|nr:unnamed protein product [Acanthoscelides obtectus]CAK1664125.1 TP53-regulating kinase [Acanthoscelides obtectus]
MKGFDLMKQGAEARLYVGMYLGKPTIAKERFKKAYRHEILDDLLTKERIKAESRAIVRCKMAGIRTPTIYLVDFNRRIIFMEYFTNSITAKEMIENQSQSTDKTLELFSLELGKLLGRMHGANIIHGDLTSSNILLFNHMQNLEVVLIDFGLAHIESNTEDKAVDLYVLERALLSTHSIADKLFDKILEGYRAHYKQGSKEVLKKMDEVRARGRKRTMVG